MSTFEHLAQLPQTHRQSVPPDYLDEMGHMNIQWYLAMYDRGAWQTFARCGATLEVMRAQQIGVFALEQHIRYLAEVRVGETVSVHTRFIGRSVKRLHFVHFMLNETRQVLASTLENIAMCMDMTQRRSTAWLPEIAARMDELIAEHQTLNWEAPLCGTLKP